jgi:hypothetical protein
VGEAEGCGKEVNTNRYRSILLALLFCTQARPAWSTPVMLASYLPPFAGIGSSFGGTNPRFEKAQTFTVEAAGTIDELQLLMNWGMGPTGDLLVDIATTDNGLPDEVLGTAVWTQAEIGNVTHLNEWKVFDFSSAHLDVVAGQELAIVLHFAGDTVNPFNISWQGGTDFNDDPYAGGSHFIRTLNGGNYPTWTDLGNSGRPRFDTGFQVIDNGTTAIPEPSTFALSLSGIVWFLKKRRYTPAN